jgi:hypothetical protein
MRWWVPDINIVEGQYATFFEFRQYKYILAVTRCLVLIIRDSWWLISGPIRLNCGKAATSRHSIVSRCPLDVLIMSIVFQRSISPITGHLCFSLLQALALLVPNAINLFADGSTSPGALTRELASQPPRSRIGQELDRVQTTCHSAAL